MQNKWMNGWIRVQAKDLEQEPGDLVELVRWVGGEVGGGGPAAA